MNNQEILCFCPYSGIRIVLSINFSKVFYWKNKKIRIYGNEEFFSS